MILTLSSFLFCKSPRSLNTKPRRDILDHDTADVNKSLVGVRLPLRGTLVGVAVVKPRRVVASVELDLVGPRGPVCFPSPPVVVDFVLGHDVLVYAGLVRSGFLRHPSLDGLVSHFVEGYNPLAYGFPFGVVLCTRNFFQFLKVKTKS